MKKENVIQLQLALFLDDYVVRPDLLGYKIENALTGLFMAIPRITPPDENTFHETPVMTNSSHDNIFSYAISLSRIDFVASYNVDTENIDEKLTDFIKKSEIIYNVIMDEGSIYRFGFVGTYAIEDKNPIGLIQEKYFKNSKHGLNQLDIGYKRQFETEGVLLNDIVKINDGMLHKSDGFVKEAIMINRDINNSYDQSFYINDLDSIKSIIWDNFNASRIREIL